MAPIVIPTDLADATVRLRALAENDASAYAAAFAEDPHLGRLLGVAVDPDEQWALQRAMRLGEAAEQGEWVELAICDARSGQFQGRIMLTHFSWLYRRCELGYWLIPGARGRGIATAAVSLVLDWVFTGLDLLRVEVATTPENSSSQALARRFGFSKEAYRRARDVERGRRVDVIQFGLLREEHCIAFIPARSATQLDEAAQIWAEATCARDGEPDVPGLELSRPVIDGVLASSPLSFVLLATAADGSTAAFAAIEPVPERQAHASVRYFGVRPSLWRRGVGRRLLRALPGELQRAGFEGAQLSVYVENRRAVQLYEHAGWVAHGEPVPHARTRRLEQQYLLRWA
jgi:RimJ/RimL family protein N-acetyltransferase